MRTFLRTAGIVAFVAIVVSASARAEDMIPPLAKIKPDHPRLLLRSKATPLAISLSQLQSLPRDADFNAMLDQLRRDRSAAAQAMVWLLTKDPAAADRAILRMRSYHYPGNVDTFHIHGHMTEFALAYDWLYNCPAFDAKIKAQVRENVAPLAAEALKVSNDHVFHNYVWMSAGGASLWSMATAGEDEASDRLFEQFRDRFNRRLYPAWQYLDGLPSEPMGYWSLYVLTPGIYTLLAAQSAFETDLVGIVRKEQHAWLDRHFENLIHSTLPDMRYIPWGDLQSGPNGGVSMEMAGAVDAATWALGSSSGRFFSEWLAKKRGLARFYGDTAIFYMLYSRQLASPAANQPPQPPLSFLAGNSQSGHFIARSGWGDDGTIVTFTCTDHFGDHHHYDQGSFIIYRRGLLAVDPPVYRQVRGPQQKTENHNTLLIGGQGQRGARGQWFTTIEQFQKNLKEGRKLETGDICFSHDAGAWAAVAGQFAQAYDCPQLKSCVRQLLFVRPDKVVVVDRLAAVEGQELPEVRWLLQTPKPPQKEQGGVVADNGKSWLRCRAILPTDGLVAVEPTPVNTQRVSFRYAGKAEMVLVHVLEVGEGTGAGAAVECKATAGEAGVEVAIGGQKFVFAAQSPYSVTSK